MEREPVKYQEDVDDTVAQLGYTTDEVEQGKRKLLDRGDVLTLSNLIAAAYSAREEAAEDEAKRAAQISGLRGVPPNVAGTSTTTTASVQDESQWMSQSDFQETELLYSNLPSPVQPSHRTESPTSVYMPPSSSRIPSSSSHIPSSSSRIPPSSSSRIPSSSSRIPSSSSPSSGSNDSALPPAFRSRGAANERPVLNVSTLNTTSPGTQNISPKIREQSSGSKCSSWASLESWNTSWFNQDAKNPGQSTLATGSRSHSPEESVNHHSMPHRLAISQLEEPHPHSSDVGYLPCSGGTKNDPETLDYHRRLQEKLWQKKRALRAAISRLSPMCRVCREREARVILLPCAHLVSCLSCLHTLRYCPVPTCVKPVRGTKEIFYT